MPSATTTSSTFLNDSRPPTQVADLASSPRLRLIVVPLQI
ncbi:uncharacterized protein G2W53_028885 [Senna tora]|uniref:Uncharacterized protein n=1 Tax=Senna tora TaxID=362788 RepID=A0A834T4C5_9FABA|nr:uncharacterized protein G2W53_028885 [Senna tora]